jgi:hypothetical protein
MHIFEHFFLIMILRNLCLNLLISYRCEEISDQYAILFNMTPYHSSVAPSSCQTLSCRNIKAINPEKFSQDITNVAVIPTYNNNSTKELPHSSSSPHLCNVFSEVKVHPSAEYQA